MESFYHNQRIVENLSNREVDTLIAKYLLKRDIMVVTDVYRGRLFYYYLWRRLKPKRQYVSKKRRKKPYNAEFWEEIPRYCYDGREALLLCEQVDFPIYVTINGNQCNTIYNRIHTLSGKFHQVVPKTLLLIHFDQSKIKLNAEEVYECLKRHRLKEFQDLQAKPVLKVRKKAKKTLVKRPRRSPLSLNP